MRRVRYRLRGSGDWLILPAFEPLASSQREKIGCASSSSRWLQVWRLGQSGCPSGKHMRRILAMEASSSRSRTIRRSQRPLALAGARIARRDARAFAGGGAAGVHFASAAKQSVARLRQLQKKMAGKPGHQATTRSIETSLCVRLRLPICRRVQFDHRTHKYHRQPEQHWHVTPPRQPCERASHQTPVLANITRCLGGGFLVAAEQIRINFWLGAWNRRQLKGLAARRSPTQRCARLLRRSLRYRTGGSSRLRPEAASGRCRADRSPLGKSDLPNEMRTRAHRSHSGTLPQSRRGTAHPDTANCSR